MSTINDYGVILDNRVKVISARTSPTVPEEYTSFVNKVDHDQLIYTATGVAGLGMGQVIVDGQIPSSDAPIQGFTKSFNQQIFTERVRLSKQTAHFLFNSKSGAKLDAEVKAKVVSVKNSIMHAKNYYMQSLLGQGWTSGFTFTSINLAVNPTGPAVDTTTADGVSYWNANHLREDGGTNWSNIVVSAGVSNPIFTFASLLASRTNHAAKKDGRGLPLIGSTLDTYLFQFNSAAYYLATSINKTLESGKFPSANPGVSGSFVDATPTAGFDVKALNVYNTGAAGTGTTSITWFGFDSKQINKDNGFQYVCTMPLDLSSWEVDVMGNMDLVMTGTEYAQFGAADLRYWMASNGTLA